jgi:hypothetical protein
VRRVLHDPAAARLAIGWLGLWCHELFRVPSAFGLTLDGSVPFIGVVAALILWQHRPIVLVRALGWVHFIGAVVTVLPLPFLPFDPEQTLIHYFAHGVYAAAQIPLVVLGSARTASQPERGGTEYQGSRQMH